MFRMVVTYNQPSDPEAFLEHYRTSHAVKTQKMPGLRQFTWGRTHSMDGTEPNQFLVAVLDFQNQEQALAALSSSEGGEAMADMEQMPHNGFTMSSYEFES